MTDIEELLELAEELIGYSSEYFQKKWRFRERLDSLRSRLTPVGVDAALPPAGEGSERAAAQLNYGR